jgi:hypothetical protein
MTDSADALFCSLTHPLQRVRQRAKGCVTVGESLHP